jgi:hypothetical protein
MKGRKGKRPKDEALLISVAESIGSTLGTIAAKANAAQKALTGRRVLHAVKRERKKLMRKSKRIARKNRNAVAANLKRSKPASAPRRSLRLATSSAKRAARRGAAKARAARRAGTRR